MRGLKIFSFVILGLAVFASVNYFVGASLSTEETEQNSRTIKTFIFQSPASLGAGNSTTTQFSIFIGEKDPIIKDAYIEVRGIAEAGSGRGVTIDINQSDSFPSISPALQQSFAIGDNIGGLNYFRLLYSGSVTASTTQYFFDRIYNPGNYDFYIKASASGAAISALQARLVVTYQFTPPSNGTGLFPASGTLISPVFDTGAANGVTYNWIMWKGSKPIGTKVKLQLATSDNSAGPWDYIAGANCDGGYYEPNNDVQQEIKCYINHNNKRYFRYKAILCSNATCVEPGGNATPQVEDVIVNWSP